MKKQLITLIVLIFTLSISAQKKIKSHSFEDGKQLSVGDMLEIGKGTGESHEYLYILQKPIAMATNITPMQRGFEGGKYEVIKMQKRMFGGKMVVYATIKTGYIKHIVTLPLASDYGEVILD